ncbi:peptidase inhibitor family I36 protein [Plantactinospora sp. S1510]|uniref:Peptidase inhibitor family I36 protein n=1 Tax=Plantactinospora alkalitolerans TaxID=2789879 RepID=A0ABS0GXU7_9ACTN|nr:peptidase inhibitor family I36 protein [Plantactinospora alkalitolerans]MBF9130921.1 peptidase inhibitor family I36 protein [Plantactinospora alkalitolerans]
MSRSTGSTVPRRRRWSALFAVGAATAALVGTAAPAAAGPANSAAAGNCPFSATLCLFDQTSFGGARFAVKSVVPGGTCVSLNDSGWGNRARSAINTASRSAALFSNDDCLGGPYQVAPNASLSDLGSFRPQSVWVS